MKRFIFVILLIVLMSVFYYFESRKPITEVRMVGDAIVFSRSNRQYGLMDKKGRIILPDTYDSIDEYKNYLFLRDSNEIHIVNKEDVHTKLKTLKDVYPLYGHHDFIVLQGSAGTYLFYDHQTIVQSPKNYLISYEPSVNGFLKITRDNRIGYMNLKGEVIVEPTYTYGSHFTEKGVAIVKTTNGDYGVINTSGEVVITPHYYSLMPTYKQSFIGLKYVLLDSLDFYEYKFGVVSSQDSVKIPFIYDSLISMDEGWYLGRIKDQFRLVHENGETFELDYKSVNFFNRNTLRFKNSEGFMGLLNLKGEVILEPLYEEIRILNENYFMVKKDHHWTILDMYFNEFLSQPYDSIKVLTNGEFVVTKGDTTRLLSTNGELKFELIDLNIHDVKVPGYYLSSSNGLYGLLDHQGNVILEPSYNHIRFTEEFLICQLNDHYQYIKRDQLKSNPMLSSPVDTLEVVSQTAQWLKIITGDDSFVTNGELEIPIDNDNFQGIQSMGHMIIIQNRESYQMLDQAGVLIFQTNTNTKSNVIVMDQKLIYTQNGHVYEVNDEGDQGILLQSYTLHSRVNQIALLRILVIDLLVISACFAYYKIHSKYKSTWEDIAGYYKN